MSASECRKFSPNIFNKSKCQNCFRGKDAHSPEALESNRATRKVSCCGYLFVAPDWDFSLAANRNKRWQRRWFVLYDDGELAYSVDEHPETVPQSVIDMTRVLEVCDAEGVTGNPFSLALTCPDKVHFIKGTSREETKKWFEVLSKFPRNTVCGKYKRNATFPCIKSAPVVKIETPVVRRDTVDGFSSKLQTAFDPGDDLYPTKDTSGLPEKKKQENLTNENICVRSSEGGMSKIPHPLHNHSLLSDPEPFRKTGDVSKWEGQTLFKSASVPDAILHTQVRGDPDGCNPDSRPSPSFSPSIDQNEFLKKGWLVKQQAEGGWSKHWFVLRNSALAFYADPIAEEAGVMDGVLDLRQATEVTPDAHHGAGFSFSIQMKDGSRLLLSAVTAKVRSQWVRALSATPSPASPPFARRSALSRVKERAKSRARLRSSDEKPHAKEGDGVKERVEEASWSIWLDVAKFCRGSMEGEEALAKVEERLRAVQAELDRAKEQSPGTPNSSGCDVVRRLQAQVRAAQAQADGLELQGARLRQAATQAERLHTSQMALMVARVEDLTAKLLAAERQVRQLRQRVAKLETRRRSSLKGKEALTLSKEYEAKLIELEAKMEELVGAEGGTPRDSMLARLHALDQRVNDAMPKIRLQVEEDQWESLSEEPFGELSRRLSELEVWVRGTFEPALLPPQSTDRLRWLRDAHDALFRHFHAQQYRCGVIVGRLRRVEMALLGLEQFMEQPSFSLCALAVRIASSKEGEDGEEAELRRRVCDLRVRVRGALSAFKGRSVERLGTALRELADDTEAHGAQPHFLAHVVAQVAHSFSDHAARSLFPWVSGGAGAQRALAQLAGELQRELRLPPGGCGVLLEYARCSVAQLARVVAMTALAEDAAQDVNTVDGSASEGESLVSLCGEEELGVSHRSISSLLCFKRKWKEQPCRSCTELRQEVSYLQGELEESRADCGALCQQKETLRAQQEIQYNEEKKNLENELQSAKSNLKKIELHHEEEVHRLQLEYESKLQQREALQLRYAEEMEELKGLCEKGLSALDAGHHRALGELERRHQRELQELVLERQRALADEAHATALALEAVRKAHSEELKKQIQNFKEEFVLKMNKKLETEAFKKCFETDLSKMKSEIMSMAEKYSVKCLENATLHEKLEILNQQLKSTTTQVVELLAKNQQLRSAQEELH